MVSVNTPIHWHIQSNMFSSVEKNSFYEIVLTWKSEWEKTPYSVISFLFRLCVIQFILVSFTTPFSHWEIERERGKMSAKETFDKWLTNKLKTLNTDESVFGSYILGILEGDETNDEKREALEGILSAIIVRATMCVYFEKIRLWQIVQHEREKMV